MLGFKSFLEETVKDPRTPARAYRIMNFLDRRYRMKNRHEIITKRDVPTSILFPPSPEWVGQKIEKLQYRDFRENGRMMDVPLSKLHTVQPYVGRAPMQQTIFNRKKYYDPDIPHIAYHPESDTYHIYDCNHRSMSERLKGHDNIRSLVMDIHNDS